MSYQTDINDAAAHLQRGAYKRALKSARSAAKAAPTSPVAPNLVGIALGATGKPNEAIAQFQKAIKLKPDYSDAQKNMAQTLLLVGRAAAALPFVNKLTGTTPNDWQVWRLKAQAHMGLGQDGAALEAATASIDKAPNLPTVYKFRSGLLQGQGRIRDAITDLEAALAIDPKDVDALTEMSLPLARQTRTAEALECVRRAVEIAPDHQPARFRLATQYVEMGQTAQAIEQYSALLDQDPTHAGALERLSELAPKDGIVALEKRINAALKTAAKPSEERASLFYAQSRVADAKNDPVGSQKSLALANKEMARLYRYDAKADAAVTQAILARFPAPIQLKSHADAGEVPIFVIGLPRSGTTLAEAMLGAHPKIAALGELGTAGFLLRETIEKDLPFTDADVAPFVSEDRRLLPDLPKDTCAYVDKMPENYRLVGFLKTAYPQARIIHITRDPRDVALSMWKSHFSGSVLSYTYDLDWMAQKFNLYARMMAHWHRVLPDGILDIAYESMAQEPKATSEQLAGFCDLAWCPEMARPDQSKAQVLTLSATQLRQPVHTGSIGKWREHKDLLAPLLERLDPALWPQISDTVGPT